jgi:hypothetical protein
VICAAILGIFLLQILPVSTVSAAGFADMEHSWYRYKEAVAYLQAKGVIDGYEDGTFKAND